MLFRSAKKAPAPPKAAPAPVLAEPVTVEAGGRPPFYKNLTLVLATLVALAAAGVGALWWQAEQDSASATVNGVLVGEDARTEVVISAADLVTRTLSYDYKNFENDMETAHAGMTEGYRKDEYDPTMTKIKSNTVKNKVVQQATIMSSAIISATEHKAKVLVFVNLTTTAGVGESAKRQLIPGNVVINLTRGDGDWRISKLELLG